MTVYELSVAAQRTPSSGLASVACGRTPAGTRNWEELLAWRFIERHGRPLLAGPVRIELLLAGVQANQDIDNLAKSCLDALNGIAFKDDRQVVELVVRKRTDGAPETRIAVSEVPA